MDLSDLLDHLSDLQRVGDRQVQMDQILHQEEPQADVALQFQDVQDSLGHDFENVGHGPGSRVERRPCPRRQRASPWGHERNDD